MASRPPSGLQNRVFRGAVKKSQRTWRRDRHPDPLQSLARKFQKGAGRESRSDPRSARGLGLRRRTSPEPRGSVTIHAKHIVCKPQKDEANHVRPSLTTVPTECSFTRSTISPPVVLSELCRVGCLDQSNAMAQNRRFRGLHVAKSPLPSHLSGDHVLDISRNCVGVTLPSMRNAGMKALWSQTSQARVGKIDITFVLASSTQSSALAATCW